MSDAANAPAADRAFALGEGLYRDVEIRPYRRPPHAPDLPLHRTLDIFTSDPAASSLEGAVETVKVPYEPLELPAARPGDGGAGDLVRGAVLEVDCRDGATGELYRRAELDDAHVALQGGYPPSLSDPRFHQQMTYAVATLVREAFKRALGREPTWGFGPGDDGPTRLRLCPHALEGNPNAYYDRRRRAVRFGYFPAGPDPRGRNLPGGTVFTALSHDIVAHEVTHGLLDGLRAHFLVPSHPDVHAFHEGFSDLVAIFLRFSYSQVLEEALRQAGGYLTSNLLTRVAAQFGQTTDGGRWALRNALAESTGDGSGDAVKHYKEGMEEHDAGAVFLSAMFDAFRTVFRRKNRRLLSIVTGGGQGELRPEDLRSEVVTELAERASRLASQFLSLAIRAIDYCPPVDLHLGEYLRALITADRDLVPDDPWGYREALVDAFRRRAIYPRSVLNLSEDALLWRPARKPIAPLGELRLGDLWPPAASAREQRARIRRAARVLGDYVTRPDHLDAFGLAPPGDHDGDRVDPPHVESVRPLRRVGPDDQLLVHVVVEIVQSRRLAGPGGFEFYGGSTLLLDENGAVRYVISKSVTSESRLAAHRSYVRGRGKRLWTETADGRLEPRPDLIAAAHGEGIHRDGHG